MKQKLLFIKTLAKQLKSTEELALEILNDPKYDDIPQYVDKSEIQNAFDEYGYKLNSFNSLLYANALNAPNIEGHYLAANLPEIESLVIDDSCTSNEIHKILDKNDDISHIAVSAYAHGLDRVVDLIKTLKRDYSDKTIYVGNVGATFSYIQKLIKPENICIGNGVPWLREKFGLPKLNRQGYNLSSIIANANLLPVNMKTLYLVSQVGCPFNCDFCITPLLQYNPFSNSKRIIESLERAREEIGKDMFVYLCEPNALFPERVWKEVFDYFMNEGKSDKNMYLLCLASLAHLQKFNLKEIQSKSSLKLFLVNYGIESTLTGGYKKNQGVSTNFIKYLSELGIITNHNFIIGLPIHTEKNLDIEIKRNLEYDSCWYFISTLKPLPMTETYNQLNKEGRIFGDDLPPEFICRDGFLSFDHPHLGKGFSVLKYAFKSYYETEKKVIDVYSIFAKTIENSPIVEHTKSMQRVIKTLKKLSELNYTLFEPRMDMYYNKIYQKRISSLLTNH